MSLKVLNLILRALEANGDAVFDREEIATWPEGDFDEALRTGLLEEAAPATEIVCPGCEEACLEEVVFVYGDRRRIRAPTPPADGTALVEYASPSKCLIGGR